MAIRGEDLAVGRQLGHAHQTGIGQAHRQISLAPAIAFERTRAEVRRPADSAAEIRERFAQAALGPDLLPLNEVPDDTALGTLQGLGLAVQPSLLLRLELDRQGCHGGTVTRDWQSGKTLHGTGALDSARIPEKLMPRTRSRRLVRIPSVRH
jgi:hypothetical protein